MRGPMIVDKIEFVDYGPEYGFFGKVVATSDVRGMTDAEIEVEVAEMTEIVGAHCSPVVVEFIPSYKGGGAR